MRGGNEYRLFYSQFRQHFHTTGAIAPSSLALARAITAPLAVAHTGTLRVLEVGAGTGAFTRAILRHLGCGDHLDLFELNPAFKSCLERRPAEARAPERGISVCVHVSDVRALPPADRYDFIVSGLPLNNFAPADVEGFLHLFMSHLRPGGTLSYFEYLYLRDLKRHLVQDAGERRRLDEVKSVVDRFLSRHHAIATPVPLNLPPAVVRHIRAD
jgi:phosphatidylethanolamine/phosphatidyl-N-methylethanolamine N-methyltransferase